MEVAPGQRHRAMGMGRAALMGLCCRKDQLQEQQVNPIAFPPSPPILSLDKRVGGEKQGCRPVGGCVSRFVRFVPGCLAPLPGHWSPAGRSQGYFLHPAFPAFSSAGHRKHAKALSIPTLRSTGGNNLS